MVRKSRKGKGTVARDGIGVSSTYMQLRSRRIVRSENSSSSVVAVVVVDNEVSSSCCESSNDYRNDVNEERDGDTETSTFRRLVNRKLFEKLREKESMENSPEIAAVAVKESSEFCCGEEKKKPSEAEIEDFFVEAEKHFQGKYNNKYNFDFEKEKPLEGRYEWFKLSD
ncbi:unnamed protein product [Cochlearia groenlandica]